jgi:hypothetical protein
MTLNKIFTGLLIAGAATSALAQSDSAIDTPVISKVDTVYVREAKGLYIEKSLLRHIDGKQLWVDVRLATMVAGETASELFQVPADLAIERGDLVTTRIGDTTALSLKLIPEVSRVATLVAKSDTLMAMTFGHTNSKSALGFFITAQQ